MFVTAVREHRYALLLGGDHGPANLYLFWGRHILKMNPALWLGGIAGARTMIAGVAAVQIEIGQPRRHDRLLVRRGFRSHLSNDVGHRHRVPHDATVVGEPWTAVAQFAEDA